MRYLRIPFCIRALSLDELNSLEIPEWNYTLLFGTETVAKWRRIVQTEPEDISAHSLLAALLVAEKRYEEAVVAYHDALKVVSFDPIMVENSDDSTRLRSWLHYDLGNALLACGRRDEARAEWETVLQLNETRTINGRLTDRARRQLIEFPADGSTPRRKYRLVIADNAGNLSTQEFDDEELALQEYMGLKASVTASNLGVALATFHPDGISLEAPWIETRKGKEAKERFMTLFHQHIGIKS